MPRILRLESGTADEVLAAVDRWILAGRSVPDVVMIAASTVDELAGADGFHSSLAGRFVHVDSRDGWWIYFDHPQTLGRVAPFGAEALPAIAEIRALADSAGLPCAFNSSQGEYVVVPGRLLGAWLDVVRGSPTLRLLAM
jgi:hypothetical protein